MKKTPSDTCEAMGFEDYAALWGCDLCYDHPPNHSGDGYKFYNFAVEGHDKKFLKEFLPAIDRTLAGLGKKRRHDKEQLLELRAEVLRRLGE